MTTKQNEKKVEMVRVPMSFRFQKEIKGKKLENIKTSDMRFVTIKKETLTKSYPSFQKNRKLVDLVLALANGKKYARKTMIAKLKGAEKELLQRLLMWSWYNANIK